MEPFLFLHLKKNGKKMTKTQKALIQNIDYTIGKNGDVILTASYLLKRGHCCTSGCLNCPYGFTEKKNPNIPGEFFDHWSEEKNDDLD